METAHHRVDWKQLFRQPGFPWLFAAMFISLFGTGMNYAGVTWWVLVSTGSTIEVSFIVILTTLPGLFVPPFGGVLIDRIDRRYLGITLDVTRAAVVLAFAGLALLGRIEVWHVRLMVVLLGVGFAIYWSTTNALVQEVVGRKQLVGANASVLIAVQGGMMAAGALVGFIYERAGLGGILSIDAATYLLSGLCLVRLRRGYSPPHSLHEEDAEPSPTIEAPPAPVEKQAVLPPIVEPGLVMGFLADLKEGLRYLHGNPRVFAIGLTYATMMAGVLSANVLLVALVHDILKAGASGYGWIEAGWAFGAIVGGFSTGALVHRIPPLRALIVALATLAVGHALFPYVRWLALAVLMNAVFGASRALGGVLTQSTIMTLVPRRLMGRTQSAFSVISTLMQVGMSFSLGWLGEHVGLQIAFLVLGVLYGVAVAAAFRARTLSRPAAP